MTGNDLFKALSAPFAPDKISWRVGSTNADKSKGMALAYIDSRDVMDRFNSVCGPFGWQCTHTVAPDGKKVTCAIGVLNPDTAAWVWRTDGAGETDVEGEKGSYSDSLKRAAVSFGVGRYLYDLDCPWVALEPAGRSVRIVASEYTRLKQILASNVPKPSAPTSPPKDENPDSQTKAWCDKEIGKWAGYTRLPDLMMWQDEREPELGRLLSKSPTMHRFLMDAFAKKQAELSK